jgi:hypothetical protein
VWVRYICSQASTILIIWKRSSLRFLRSAKYHIAHSNIRVRVYPSTFRNSAKALHTAGGQNISGNRRCFGKPGRASETSRPLPKLLIQKKEARFSSNGFIRIFGRHQLVRATAVERQHASYRCMFLRRDQKAAEAWRVPGTLSKIFEKVDV